MMHLRSGFRCGGHVDDECQAVERAVASIRDDERRQLGWFERSSLRPLPVRRAVYVTPSVVEEDCLGPPDSHPVSIVAYTTEVSLAGIGLAHDEPIATRYAIITFDREDADPISLLVEIQWYDHKVDGSYRSRARLMAVTDTPDFLCYPDSPQPRCAEHRALQAHGIRRQEVVQSL